MVIKAPLMIFKKNEVNKLITKLRMHNANCNWCKLHL